MTDRDLLAAFDAGTLDPAGFDHRAHVRVAWLCLRADGPAAGAERMARGLRRITAAVGVPGKFDAALTRRWCTRVQEAIDRRPALDDFDAFAASEPGLFRRRGPN